jgi:hypothetical protein
MDLTPKNKKIVEEFIRHCKDELGIVSRFTVKLINRGLEHPTAGTFNPSTSEIFVCCKNRAIADCLRTIAHEMTHLKQLEEMDHDEGFPTSDEELQPLEDMANTYGGRLVRFWGRKNREIYEDLK